MRLFRRAGILIALLFCSFLVMPQQAAYALSPFANIDCTGEAASSAVCEDKSRTADPITGTSGLIMKIVNVIAFAAGAAAIIIIILAGLRFVTSGGSSDDVAGARRTLTYAVVGLIVLVLARTLVAFILGRI